MYLKELKLNGFKSFAKPTTLEFAKGVTAVVGPNGSGKSNVADAIRWILGEQSMKNIRSQNSRDLIFSGSKARGKLNRANVSLSFDNQSGRIPLDYSEVVISRNIFRDGTTEYFINQNQSRLIEAAEILAKANIGHKGFSIINQGMESELLKYSPTELYNLIEEASGVRYLQIKKRRSERRLKRTQTNLAKASTILAELRPHLKYLKKEAGKADRRKKLMTKLKEYQSAFFIWQAKEINSAQQKDERKAITYQKQVSTLKEEVDSLRKKSAEEAQNIRQGGDHFRAIQRGLEKILDQKIKLAEQIANLGAEIRLFRARAEASSVGRGVAIDSSKANQELNSAYLKLKKFLAFKELSSLLKEIQKLVNRLESLVNKPQSAKVKLAEDEKLDKLLIKQKKLTAELEAVNKHYQEEKEGLRKKEANVGQERFFELGKKLRAKEENLNRLESEAREINWRRKQTEENRLELEKELSRSGLKFAELLKRPISDAENNSELAEKISHLKYQINEIGSIDELTLQEYRETEERYQKLLTKIDDLEKTKKNIQGLIVKLTKDIKLRFGKNLSTINQNFNKYFRLLFGGGKAHLKEILRPKRHLIVEEADKEEGEDDDHKGLEVKANLPGKKINNLKLFSGGEKALTSIALIFAIISSNPPPFLVLDEVDATLDESNARRFAKLLAEFRQNTQFIVITHNRETMAQADILYGVSMSEGGVSSLLSLKLGKGNKS